MNARIAAALIAVSAAVPSLGCISNMGCILAEAREAEKVAQEKTKEEEEKERVRELLLTAARQADGDRDAFVAAYVNPELTALNQASISWAPPASSIPNKSVTSQQLLQARAAIGEADVEGAKEDEEKANDKYSETQEHFGVRWGFGPAIVGDGTTEVESAQIVDGKVRVSDSREYEAKILLETHKFFWGFYDCESDPTKRKTKAEEGRVTSTDMLIGFGPFVALSLGGDDVIDGIGFGLMLGGQIGGGASFNVGVGPYLASEIQVLADGFVDGEDAPAGATEVGFAKRSDWKTLVMFSFSWSF